MTVRQFLFPSLIALIAPPLWAVYVTGLYLLLRLSGHPGEIVLGVLIHGQ